MTIEVDDKLMAFLAIIVILFFIFGGVGLLVGYIMETIKKKK